MTSTDGPPGLYVVNSSGGRPRFLRGGDFVSPNDMRFSPDGQTLVCIIGLQLAFVDVATGATSFPMYTHNLASFPDWSPDGRYVAYRRLIQNNLPPDPPDSAGLHIYEPATGRDWPLRHDGEVLFGSEPTWSPDRVHIVFIAGPDPVRLMVTSADGSELRMLVQADESNYISNIQWYRRPEVGADGVLGVSLLGSFYVPWSGGIRLPWRPLGSGDDYARDGRFFVTILAEPITANGVLFIQDSDDFSGASRRQLTFYSPAQPTPSNQTSVEAASAPDLKGRAEP